MNQEYEQQFLKKRDGHRKWREANKEHVRNRGRDNMKKWREANTERALDSSRKHEEKRKQLHADGVYAWEGKKRVKGPNWKEYQKQKQRDKYAQNEAYRDRKKSEAKAWIENNHRSWLLRQIKLRAKKMNIKFNLTLEDIVVPERCPVLGIKLERGKGQSCDASPTVDRINAKRGYVKGNVAIISRKANSLKGHATAAQHRRIAEWMESVS